MAKITVEFGELVVEIVGVDHLWALRSQLEIPLAHIRSAACGVALPPEWQQHTAAVPTAGALSAGRFEQQGCTVYWEVRDPAKAVVIELADEFCARLVVEADDPADVAARINRALAREGH